MSEIAQGKSILAISRELGKDRRVITEAVSGLEPAGRGPRGPLYNVRDVMGALEKMRKKPVREKVSLWEAEGRLKLAQAEMAEVKLSEKRGEVVPVDAVFVVFDAVVTAFKADLRNIPSGLAPWLVGKSEAKIKEQMQDAIDEALKKLSRLEPESFTRELEKHLQADEAEPGEPDAAPAVDGKRVGRPRKGAVPRGVSKPGPVENG